VPRRVKTFGFDDLAKLLDPQRFRATFKAEMLKAQNAVGAKFRQEAQDRIDDKSYQPNRPFTVMIKGSTTPLVRKGDLHGSLTWNAEPFRIAMGTSDTRRARNGRLVAEILHNGATIQVTNRIRRAVFAQLSKSMLRRLPERVREGPGKPFWVIPARPYIADVFESSAWRVFARSRYVRALQRTIAKQLGGLGSGR